ncbi:hypothetical protein CHLRE_01g043650v5 [Chlamydomonas reinhardtii]|uniref:Uncharacterized protein n=1 Tax=Chlamydomonas reinhardtii TaxID=3055 RepID=A0A2K3E7K0_CHLRE|nr:uncharacterized protein CHLRE_01g043650v5 [Chlamydomonas reinhardtii]PNW88766.1 hypothetical protein CHLRE_01g043650v5 [Chlamydomonas reinhardtii]
MEFDRENPSPLARLPGQEQAWNDLSVPEVERAYLEQLAGVERLEDATSLQLVVNSATGGSIAHLGTSLPSLHELNLNGSTLASLRDLGTGFRMLQVLWVSRCGLRSLDGLNGLTALRELYAAYNDIADLQPVDCCPQLEVLDVECNCVQHVDDAAHYLAACPHLQTLSMAGNPAAGEPHYLQALCGALPALATLDDEPVTPADRGPAGASPHKYQDGTAGGSPYNQGAAAFPAPPLKAAATSLSHKPSTVAAAALGLPEDAAAAASSSGAAAPSGPLDAEEVALVVAGIKHARVGVDSHEFREIEMNLLVAAADGTDVQLEGRPGTATLLPSSTSTWMRTLRSSREGSLAILRASHAAAATGAATAAAAGSSHSPSASSGASPAGSRPPSGRTSAPQERWAMPSAAGVGFSVSSPGPGLPPSGLRRPGSGGGGAGGGGGGAGPGFGESPSLRRPGSGEARPGTSTSRPFSARPGTAASFSVRIGTSQSTGAAPGTSSSLGLYWAKNRIGGGASGGGGAAGGGDGAAGGGGGAAGAGTSDGDGPAGSKLTQGTEAAFGGSLARDLRKWKGAAARAGGTAGGAGGRTAGGAAGGSAASALSASGGNGLSMALMRGGQLDPKALLEELKRWKLETADRVLFVDPDEADGAAGDAGWAGADGNGNGNGLAAASVSSSGRGAGHADILRLSSSQDGAGHDPALLGPEPASSPAVPSSPLQPARPPPGAAAAGRRKMVLAKVCRDIAADSVGSSGASISEILASRPVRTPTGAGAGPSTAWGEPHTPERASAPASQHHSHAHHHNSGSGVGGGPPRPGSARSGCSSSGQSDHGLGAGVGAAGGGNSFAAPAYLSRPGSREESASSVAAGGLPSNPSLTRQRSASSRAPGLPPGPSAPTPGAYRVTSVAGEVDVRLSNPHPVTRLDEG